MIDRRAMPILKVGVVADTHIPDRAFALHPGLLPALRSAGVQVILHAGDVSKTPVLDALREIAPLYVARGNRDWYLGRGVKLVEHIELAGTCVALMHGHGGMIQYVIDKIAYLREGYRFQRYLALLQRASQGAKVIVFGHTHHKFCSWIDEQLIFNPGSASFGAKRGADPSWGLLKFFPEGKVSGEIFGLHGYQLLHKVWVQKD